MPTALVFFRQETPYSCVPACLKMVLHHFGLEISEDELRLRSYTTLWGTRAGDAVTCVKHFGLNAEEAHDASLENLRDWLNLERFPILFIDLQPLTGEVGRHAIVTEEISETEAIYLDPLIGRRTARRETLNTAWGLAGRRAIVIWR